MLSCISYAYLAKFCLILTENLISVFLIGP